MNPLEFKIGADISSGLAGIKKFESELNGLNTGSIAQLRKAVVLLKGELASFTPAQLSSPFGKDLASSLLVVTTELKGLEKQAQFTGTSTSGAFNKIFGSVKQLAYILPGIGIAGLLGFATDALVTLFNEITKGSEPLSKFADSQRVVNEAIGDAKSTYTEAIKNVTELRINIDLAKNGFLEKDKVVKEYNDTIGKTTGKVNSLNEAEAALNKNAEAYIQFTLLKAAANLALEQAAQKAVKAALIPTEDVSKNLNFWKRLNLPFENAPSRKGQETKFLAPVIEGVKKEQKQLEDIGRDFEKQAAELAKKFHFDFFQGKEEIKIPKVKVRPDNLQILPSQHIQSEVPEITLPKARIKILSPEFNIGAPTALAQELAKFESIYSILGKKIQTAIKTPTELAQEALAQLRKDAMATAEAISQVLGGAFDGLIDSVNKGKSAVQGFVDGFVSALSQLIKKLISTAILAAALSAIIGGKGTGFLDFLKPLLTGGKLPGFASGGIVTGPMVATVGERGAEAIIPLDRLQGILGGMANNGNMNITGRLVAQGRDLVAVIARENSSQLRNT